MAVLRYLAAAIALCALQGCAPDEAVTPPQPVQTAPRLPGKVMRTDGEGDVAVGLAGNAACSQTSAAEAASALASTNAARASGGMAPLRPHPALQKAAEAHACEMARRGTMTHVGRATSGPAARVKALGYKPRITAENIAAGRLGPELVFSEWVNSPKHLANIMISGLSHFGVGHAVGADGKSHYWAAVYAAPR